MYFLVAACVAIDESNKRLFLSDVNHHRIVVTDGDGVILDCVCWRHFFNDLS